MTSSAGQYPGRLSGVHWSQSALVADFGSFQRLGGSRGSRQSRVLRPSHHAILSITDVDDMILSRSAIDYERRRRNHRHAGCFNVSAITTASLRPASGPTLKSQASDPFRRLLHLIQPDPYCFFLHLFSLLARASMRLFLNPESKVSNALGNLCTRPNVGFYNNLCI